MEIISAKKLTKSAESVIAQSETNDCFVYALATSFDLEYDQAHKIAKAEFGREPKRGTSGKAISSRLAEIAEGTAPGFNNRTVTQVIDKPTSTYKVYGEEVNRALKVKSFVKKFSQGTYLVLVRKHAITIKDGAVVDNNEVDCLNSVVRKAFKVEPVQEGDVTE